jgi:hypothetical protein
VSGQRLGPRKLRALTRIIGQTVTKAAVWSHVQSGRIAHFTVADGRIGRIDRVTGEWSIDPEPGRGTNDETR